MGGGFKGGCKGGKGGGQGVFVPSSSRPTRAAAPVGGYGGYQDASRKRQLLSMAASHDAYASFAGPAAYSTPGYQDDLSYYAEEAPGRGRKGGGKKPRQPPGPPPEPTPALPPAQVRWIQVGPESTLVVERALPELAPAVCYQEGDFATLLSASRNILYELAGEEEVELVHDAEWEEYPYVGDALKATGVEEEQALCVAIIPSQSKWAVGVGGKWKTREQAARLALSVALAANVDDFGKVGRMYPEFATLCESAGIDTSGFDAGAVPPPEEAWQPAKKKRKGAKASADGEAEETGDSGLGAAAAEPEGPGLPRDKPLWITMPPDASFGEKLESMPLDMILAVCTDGNARKGLYGKADAVIGHFLENEGGESLVEYCDDANWVEFPGVGAALKEVSPKEECMCVAVCESKATWAVGVGMKGKNRYSAARLALAATLALQAAEAGDDLDPEEYPTMTEFIEEVKAAKDSFLLG